MAGKFTILEGKDAKVYFNLRAANGQIILQSQGYEGKDGAKAGIESVRKHARAPENYEVATAANGELYFVLKSSNGEVIGKSETYRSRTSCDNGMSSVAVNAPDATVVEEGPGKSTGS